MTEKPTKDKKDQECFSCGKKGRDAVECWSKPREGKGKLEEIKAHEVEEVVGDQKEVLDEDVAKAAKFTRWMTMLPILRVRCRLEA